MQGRTRTTTPSWTEIRSNIIRVAGKRLPVELADHIFDLALEVEDVPASPSLYHKVRPKAPGSRAAYLKERGGRTRLVKRKKPEYEFERTKQTASMRWREILYSETESGED